MYISVYLGVPQFWETTKYRSRESLLSKVLGCRAFGLQICKRYRLWDFGPRSKLRVGSLGFGLRVCGVGPWNGRLRFGAKGLKV